MDRRAALALRQAYRRDAALLLQSSPLSLSKGSMYSGIVAPSSSKAAHDVLQTNDQSRGKKEDKSTGSSLSVPPPPGVATKTEDTNDAVVLYSSENIDLVCVGRTLVLRASREAPPPPPSKGRRGTSTAATSTEDDGQLRPEHYCAPCGALFFLGSDGSLGEELNDCIGSNNLSNTTVRVRSVSRGRTRRRRAARVRARQGAHDAAQRKDRGGGRQWGGGSKSDLGGGVDHSANDGAAGDVRAGGGHGHAVATYTQADIERRKANGLLYNVRDGTKHHSVVYTCGNCGHKTKLAGIDCAARERRRKGNVQDQQQNKDAKKAVHRKKKGQNEENGRKFNNHGTVDKRKQTNDESNAIGGDFISLAPLSKAQPSKKQEGETKTTKKASYSFQDKATQSKKAANQLDQSSNRKRKKNSGTGAGSLGVGGKKNAGNKKSKLMDFLSSLNG